MGLEGKKRFKHAPSDTLRDYTYYTKWPWIPIDYMAEDGGISVYRKDTLYHNPCVGAYVPGHLLTWTLQKAI